MTTPVSGATAPTSISDVLGKNAASNAQKGGSELGQDAFLKLLVAQLRYQDPSNPSDGAQFLAQTAQFTQVEKLNQLVESQQSAATAQLVLGASNLVGRTVSYLDSDNAVKTGTVDSLQLTTGGPLLQIGDVKVPLSAVTEVRRNS
jgi:flagellar basal-body rod modification protein FlgD